MYSYALDANTLSGERKMNWISIKEKNPPQKEQVLVQGFIPELDMLTHWVLYLDETPGAQGRLTMNDVQFVNGKMYGCIATHWMKIPEFNESAPEVVKPHHA